MTNKIILIAALKIVDWSNSKRDYSAKDISRVLEQGRLKELKDFSGEKLRDIIEFAANSRFVEFYEIKASQILQVVKYLEENTVYVPHDWGKVQEDVEPTPLRDLKTLATDYPYLTGQVKW